MDSSATLPLWIAVVSTVALFAMVIAVAATFVWHHKQSVRQAEAWGRQLLTAQENERGRIARELHDDVIQRLWAVRILAGVGSDGEAGEAMDGIIGDLRTLSHDLHPPALRFLHLGEALRDMADRHFTAGSPAITIDVPDNVPIDEAAALALYRVSQEAFTNIAKHAKATQVWLTLTVLPDQVRLQIKDDGIGHEEAKSRHSFGMRGMRERMEMLGGSTTITSTIGKGTTVNATVPIK